MTTPTMTSHLVINGVKLGEQYPIDDFGGVVVGVVQQGSVEFAELVNSLVAHQRLPHKQDQVRGVDMDQLGREGRERRRGDEVCQY